MKQYIPVALVFALMSIIIVAEATSKKQPPKVLPHISFAEELRAVKKGDTLVVFNDGQTEDVGIYHHGYILSPNEHLAICTADIVPANTTMHLTTDHITSRGLCPGGSICVTGYYVHRTPRIFNFLHRPQNRRRFISDYYKTDTGKVEYKATTQTNNTGTVTTSIGYSCCWIHKKPRVLNFLYQREHRRKYVPCN